MEVSPLQIPEEQGSIAFRIASKWLAPEGAALFRNAYDRHLYRERKEVEWFINLLKQYRRVATRYEKTARNFLGFVHVASIMILLR
jgi:transposase